MSDTRISYIDELEADENVGELAAALRMCHRNKDVITDRLAKLEDGIRALADELQGEVEQHDPNKSFDEYSGGLADKAEMVEDRLRALLDGE